MKRKSLISLLLITSLLFLTFCGDDDTTELAWINESDGAINEIIWANYDALWVKAGGYNPEETTESKEINQFAGDVACNIYDDDAGDFIEANVTIGETTSSALVLSEGESYVYTITAQPTK
ncbi:MAG: hypothetical protein SVZ03_00660 [Spirochaetota bacterium]|nr:hypothetical protein [Spirochaetota bacterium]